MPLKLTLTRYPQGSSNLEMTKILDDCGSIEIGRSSKLTGWVLKDPERIIENRHCIVSYQDGYYVLTDISSNGTYVNDVHCLKRSSTQLANGDHFTVGLYEIAVTIWTQQKRVDQAVVSLAAETAISDAKGTDAIEGVLYFEPVNGSEGGYWAIQDKRFISPNETRFVCRKCCVYWDKVAKPDGPSGNQRQFRTLFQLINEPKVCALGQHEFELASNETWAGEGRHLLRDGDHLTIYDKSNMGVIVWSGTIHFRTYDLCTEKVFGHWIRVDQEGVERETWARWFFDKNPAKLIPAGTESRAFSG